MLKLLKSLLLVLLVLLRGWLMKKGRIYKVIIITCIIILLRIITLGIFQTSPPEDITSLNRIIASSNTADMKFRGFSSISPEGRYVAYNDIILEGREVKDLNICLYDRKDNKRVDLSEINSSMWDMSPSVSGDGRFIAFQSNRAGKHTWNIYLYDVREQKIVDLPGLNTFMPEINPNISADGNFITFSSLRSAKLDIYVYNRTTREVMPVPKS